MPLCGEQLPEGAVVDVAERVVGHQPLGADPVGGEEGEGAFHEAGHGRCLLVVVELDVGEPGAVVDDRVGKVVADQCLLAAAAQRL